MTADPNFEDLIRGELTRRQLVRRLGAGGLLLSTPAILAACSGGSGPSGQPVAATGPIEQIDHLDWLTTATTSLDMARSGSYYTPATVATEPILILGDKLEPVGHLAERWRAV